MNDSKQILSIENNNDNYKWNDSKGNMVFYNFNSNQNFPISINYRNTDTYKKNNIPEVKIVNENDPGRRISGAQKAPRPLRKILNRRAATPQ